MGDGIIRVEVEFSKQFFPKFDEPIYEGDFGIVSWKVLKVEEGAPQVHPIFKTITVKGHMCEFSKYETYTIIAREAPNDFGMQYDLIYIGQVADFSSPDVQRTFLERILTPLQVESLFDTLDNPIETIKNHDLKTLCTVKGVGESTAYNMIEKYEENKDLSQVYIELDDYGLTNRMVQKLVDTYGSPTTVITKVKTNPYQLASEVNGIGFRKADAIALDHGLEADSIFRVQGFIEFKLEEMAENGNSYVYANDIMYMIEDELGAIENSRIGEAVNGMVEDGVLGLLEGEDGQHKRVYLTRYYELELEVAKEISRILSGGNNFVFDDWKSKIERVEEQQGWTHTEEQVKGIKGVLENPIYVINGKGGTGKTSVVTAMLEALDTKKGKYSFAQTALSGRASAKLQEVTGADGLTMHRLLAYHPEKGFQFNSENQLPQDIIILDEISLVGGQIFLNLLRAIRTGSKLVILGDDGQLESIGCMNLARDLIRSMDIPSIELNQIHRQAQRSGIITGASYIRDHKQLFDRNFSGVMKMGELQDFEVHVVKNLDETRPTMVEYFKEWLPKVGDIMDLQLLVPVNERGDASVSKLNNDIQFIYNPPNRRRREIEVVLNKEKEEGFIIREKDKIMVMKNNYKALNEEGEETPVFNGWIGEVSFITDRKEVVAYFDVIKETVVLPNSFLKHVQLGYACSIHKYQGSSAKVVIGGIDYSTPPFMRTKELVYTLVTRAEKYCVLVSQNSALREAINTSGVSDKNTFLVELLKTNLK